MKGNSRSVYAATTERGHSLAATGCTLTRHWETAGNRKMTGPGPTGRVARRGDGSGLSESNRHLNLGKSGVTGISGRSFSTRIPP